MPNGHNDPSTALLSALPVPAFIFDIEERRFLFINRLFCEMMGYSEEELLRIPLDEIRPPEDIERFHRALGELPPEGAIEWRYLTKDKRILHVTLRYRNMTYANHGRAIAARFVVVTDQSDQPTRPSAEVYGQ